MDYSELAHLRIVTEFILFDDQKKENQDDDF